MGCGTGGRNVTLKVSALAPGRAIETLSKLLAL